ncbi:homoserine kinase [Nocardioides anomalus]|uniref:Homoserine kinase n=1 Tax=Nocardioides anomalus TaxID=2712223 RepID=A0A6G6WF50_9ACTN|nr:homoserine kinase [Nocardioides anomalus]QIG43839.1 homoserine kinase [Nocardioides anomalus]
MSVRVTVPATSANLGPGFDCLGLALGLRDELEGELTDTGIGVDVVGEGAGSVPLDETHLVLRAMRLAFDALGERPSGLRLSCRNAIPHARGLGSSSAAIVGGLVLARALVVSGPERLSDDDLLALAVDQEGHPDNVAPALHGGFVLSGTDERGELYAVGSPVDPQVSAVVFLPPEPLSTEVARGLLPASVPHADAAADAGAAALLVAALAGRTDQLWRATRDRLHQEYRRPAMPASLDLVDRLRADGHAAVVSGAGPTVLVLVAGEDGAGADLAAYAPDGWRHLRLPVSADGARVEPS